MAHFPFLPRGQFGSPDGEIVPPTSITREQWGFTANTGVSSATCSPSAVEHAKAASLGAQ
jgi:hypothetical protein